MGMFLSLLCLFRATASSPRGLILAVGGARFISLPSVDLDHPALFPLLSLRPLSVPLVVFQFPGFRIFIHFYHSLETRLGFLRYRLVMTPKSTWPRGEGVRGDSLLDLEALE